jgi:hypothetical protein
VRRRDGADVTALLRLVTALGALVAVTACLHHVAGVPESDMSASRVVPAVALARGFPIYAGPSTGPIIDFMYGPVAAIAFLPAALASTPSGALAVAAALNALAFFLPMAWLHRRAIRRGDAALAGFVLFVLAVVRDPGLAFSALTIHADAPALGLGALACGLLATGPRPPSAGRLAAIATAIVLAAWTKQTIAPLALALVGMTLVRDGVGAAARLAAWLAGVGLAVSVVWLVAFDPRALWFNMVTLPSRMPWYGEADGGRWATVGFVAGLLARLTWLPALVLVALAVGARRYGVRVHDTPCVLLAVVGILLAPLAVVGGAKVGGFLNTFSVCTYFLVAAATVGVAGATGAPGRVGAVATALLAAAILAIAVDVGRGPAGLRSVGRSVAELEAWRDNPHERAFAVARADPGEIYFPWNPLSTLLAENRLDDNEIGAWNRDLAGVPIDDALWRRYLPPRLRLVAFRPPTGAFAWLPEPSARLPELVEPVTIPGLEGWTVLGRAVAAPSTGGLERDPHGATAPPHP